MNRLYISGRISGLSRITFETNFRRQEQLMYALHPDATVINPTKIKPLFGIDAYWCYMIADIFYLFGCDTISMQPNWNESRGAKIELAIAILTNKKIIWL